MTRHKRILFVLPYSESISSFIFSKRQIYDIEKLGFFVEIFYLKSRFSIYGLFKERRRLSKLIKSFKPDIIHSHYGTVTGFISSTFSKTPFVVTFQGSDLLPTKDVFWIREKIGKILSKICEKRAQRIICVSKAIYEKLSYGKIKAEIIPFGTDINFFVEMDKDLCKKKLSLALNINYIFFNASNPIVKRLDIAKEVVQLLKNENVELLSLSGETNPEEIPFYLNASSLLLVCSDSEGSPMVIKEAMSCNLPIVSVDVGDIKERISNIDNCFIVSNNPIDISDKIKKIIKENITLTNGRNILIESKMDSQNIAILLAQKIYSSLKVNA